MKKMNKLSSNNDQIEAHANVLCYLLDNCKPGMKSIDDMAKDLKISSNSCRKSMCSLADRKILNLQEKNVGMSKALDVCINYARLNQMADEFIQSL